MAARLMLFTLAALLASPPAAALPDPTALPKRLAVGGPADAAPAEAGLAWVRVDGRNSVAWYGGTTVRLGDPVEGGKVSAIHEDHIVITGQGGRRAVYLLEAATRTQPQPRRPVAR